MDSEERSCDTCKRDCPFATGYDHAPFVAHFTRVDSKTFVCVSWSGDLSWSDDPDAPIETEDIRRSVRQPGEK